MDEKNVKSSSDFNFLNERVVERRKWNITKLGGFIVFCMILFILAVFAVIFWANPYMKDNSDSHSGSASSDDENKETETTTQQISGIEDIAQGVVIMSVNLDEDMEEVLYKQDIFFSGLVLKMGNEIKILTDCDFVKGKKEITVYINDKKCVGKIYGISEEYGVAIISVNVASNNLEEDDMKCIKCADISLNEENQYAVGDSIMFVGNTYGKEKFVANGSLTSVENMYNIVDVELEVMNTDILSSDIKNGFIFNEQGIAIGMVNSAFNESITGRNTVFAISFKRINLYIDKLIRGNQISYLGIYGRKVIDEVIESIDKDMPYGIYISNTEDNSPAYVAGIMKGDILVEFDGREVVSFDEFSQYLQECGISDEVSVTVMRKGKDGYKEINYMVKIGGR